MLISPCGANCEECPFFNNPCKGCRNLKGKVFWAADHIESGKCPMYDCAVNIKKYESCGKCKDLPCEKFYNMKDPNMTDEEHQESIIKRVQVLKAGN